MLNDIVTLETVPGVVFGIFSVVASLLWAYRFSKKCDRDNAARGQVRASKEDASRASRV